ncbi:MAG: hypothetical protein R6V62_04770 [Candidatus Fermentibacteraceae bacterium]
MRLTLLFLPVVAFVLQAASVPFAYEGVLNSPNAYVLQHTEIGVGIGATAYTIEDSTGAAQSEFITAGHINFGILGYGQVGMSYLGDGGIVANLKVMILREGIDVPAFAIGCENMFAPERVDVYQDDPGVPDSTGLIMGLWDEEGYYNYDHAQNWSAYGVASKSMRYLLGIPVTVNLGIGVGRFVGVIGEGGAMNIGSAVAHGLFGSIVWDPSNKLSIALEQDGKDFNLGLSYDVNRYVTLNLAAAEFEMALFPPEGQNFQDPCQNPKFTIAVTSRIGPLVGGGSELEREQQRIARARARLEELEARRRAAEAELQRLRDLLDESR